ncbi:MAG: alpha-2-macroglobulin family protein, partial [Gemmataceae bacterium]
PEQFRDRLRKEAEKLPDNQRLQQEQDAERILVLTGQSTPMTTDFDEEKALEVERVFEEKSVQLMEKREQARVRLEDESREKVKIKAAQALLARHESLIEDVKVAATRLLPVLAGLFLVGGLIIILVNRSIRGLAFAGIGGICGVLFLMNGLDPLEKPGIATRSNREIAMAPRGFDKGADAAVMQAVPMAAPPPGAVDGNLAIVKDAAAKDDRGGLGGPGNMQAPGLGGIGAEQGQKDLADRPEIANMARNRGGEPMAAEKGKELGRMEEKVAGLDEAKAPGAIRLNQPMMRQGGLVLGGQRDGMNQRFAGRGMNQQRDLGRAPVVGMGAQEFPGNGMAQGRPGIGGPGFPGMGGMAPPMAPGFFGPGGGGGRAMVPMAEPLVVREYAHVRPSGSTPGMRSDFAETLYWHPVLLLPDGHASLTFDLCDSVTSFQVGVFAHTLDGRLGSGTAEIASRLPFTLSPKVPVEVTSGDRIDLPVAISNNTPDPRQVELKLGTLNGLELLQGKQDERFEVLPEGRVRRLFGLKPTLQQGKASLILEGVTQPFASDSIRESIKIVPDGFPVTGSSSNLLEKSATHTVTLPQWLPGTLEAKVEVFPSTLADLQKGLEGLLQEPYGCFEQTSTTNYPNILVLDYLRTSDKS